ncbi:CHC2 zinc finger domain-containing protein [Phenylobacterium sp.]|uniref:DUF7146 domain-containing protein n=1 Tax=Phenylobacterium sp. TaxID=1871053 RepID=UPI003919EA50
MASDLLELFARARDADVEAVAGVKLFRVGRRLRGECPLCGASKGKRGSGAFSVDPEARLFKCFACDAGGDVVDLERDLRGGSLREAAERLAGGAWSSAPLTRRPEPRRVEGERPQSGAERLAAELWDGAQPSITGTLGETYLRARGLTSMIGRIRGGLRFHPAARWGWDEQRGSWITAPAIVGRVRTFSGRTGGVHCTYLRADGSGKTRLDPAKRMWGPQKDSDGRPGGVWLSDPEERDWPLVVGEGIESTLSAMQLLGRKCRGVATLSLGALQGGWLTDAWGRIDPAAVAPDPERPAFTWPDQDEVIVAVDRDMAPIEVKVRKLGGGTLRRRLSGEERARICAGLAAAAWKQAGANAVRVIAPAAGRDFNDELLARVGA